jgi:hypothetical protein
MDFHFNPLMDWNPVIHLLDELSDGEQFFRELRSMAVRYDRKSFVEALLFLAERELIMISSKSTSSKLIALIDLPHRLRLSFDCGDYDPELLAGTCASLTAKGEETLQLFGIGHPR